MKIIISILTLTNLLISSASFSQNNAIIIDGGTATNNINMVINQPNPLGIICWSQI